MALVRQAIMIAQAHWRDRRTRPSEADLRDFEELARFLHLSAVAARRIATRMERRLSGEPEFRDRRWPGEP
jgi:hypothetical protein